MKTIQTQLKYVEWLSAEDMHKASKEWLSELRFIKDEHVFFKDLIATFTAQILDSGKFSDTKEIIYVINRSQKQNNTLIEAVKIHENELLVMVDGVDQIEEEKAYSKEHSDLIIAISEYIKEYKSLKTQLFDIIKNIKKEGKLKRLINKI
jgi:hypothetical protein